VALLAKVLDLYDFSLWWTSVHGSDAILSLLAEGFLGLPPLGRFSWRGSSEIRTRGRSNPSLFWGRK